MNAYKKRISNFNYLSILDFIPLSKEPRAEEGSIVLETELDTIEGDKNAAAGACALLLPWSYDDVGMFCTGVEEDVEVDEYGVKDDVLSACSGIVTGFGLLTLACGKGPERSPITHRSKASHEK